MLDTVPDLRQALKTASGEQLADIFDAFDVTVSYDKASQQLDLTATVTPELLPQNDDDHSGERSRVLEVAGERFVLMGDPPCWWSVSFRGPGASTIPSQPNDIVVL